MADLQLVKSAQSLMIRLLMENGTVLRIFTNNHTPTNNDTAANYTEDTDTGYAPVTLLGSDWTIVDGNPSQATHPAVMFVYAAVPAGNRYGYYVTDLLGALLWAQLFDTPAAIANPGDDITINPVFTQKDTTE